jgi:hypothetical protein
MIPPPAPASPLISASDIPAPALPASPFPFSTLRRPMDHPTAPTTLPPYRRRRKRGGGGTARLEPLPLPSVPCFFTNRSPTGTAPTFLMTWANLQRGAYQELACLPSKLKREKKLSCFGLSLLKKNQPVLVLVSGGMNSGNISPFGTLRDSAVCMFHGGRLDSDGRWSRIFFPMEVLVRRRGFIFVFIVVCYWAWDAGICCWITNASNHHARAAKRTLNCV